MKSDMVYYDIVTHLTTLVSIIQMTLADEICQNEDVVVIIDKHKRYYCFCNII